jgi:hypothetical protein
LAHSNILLCSSKICVCLKNSLILDGDPIHPSSMMVVVVAAAVGQSFRSSLIRSCLYPSQMMIILLLPFLLLYRLQHTRYCCCYYCCSCCIGRNSSIVLNFRRITVFALARTNCHCCRKCCRRRCRKHSQWRRKVDKNRMKPVHHHHHQTLLLLLVLRRVSPLQIVKMVEPFAGQNMFSSSTVWTMTGLN